MGSKSSSGSLVKSVESMLPKGVNFKHVLLAVLVGLLLCMIFSQNVEGFQLLPPGTTDAKGYCHSTGLELPIRECQLDTKTKGNANATQLEKMKGICSSAAVLSAGCKGINNKDTAVGEKNPAGATIVEMAKDTDINKIAFSCDYAKETRDFCGPIDNPNDCDNNKLHNCKYEDCSRAVSNIGAENSKELYTIDMNDPFQTEYDHWRKCISKNNLTKFGKLTNNAAKTALTEGQVPGSTTKITGLDGWLKGGVAQPFSKNEANKNMDATELQNRNAIPMNGNGTVPTNMAKYLPPNWKSGFEQMYQYCKDGSQQGTASKKHAAIGWNSDFRSLKCINYNPKVDNLCIMKPKCPRKKVCGHPDIGPDGKVTGSSGENHYDKHEYSKILGSSCSIGDKLLSAGQLFYDDVTCLPSDGVDAGLTGVGALASAV